MSTTVALTTKLLLTIGWSDFDFRLMTTNNQKHLRKYLQPLQNHYIARLFDTQYLVSASNTSDVLVVALHSNILVSSLHVE